MAAKKYLVWIFYGQHFFSRQFFPSNFFSFYYKPFVKRKKACSKSLHTLIIHPTYLFLLSVVFLLSQSLIKSCSTVQQSAHVIDCQVQTLKDTPIVHATAQEVIPACFPCLSRHVPSARQPMPFNSSKTPIEAYHLVFCASDMLFSPCRVEMTGCEVQ